MLLVLGRVQWGNDSPTSKGSGTADLFIYLFIPFKGVGFQGGVEDFLTTNGHEWARMGTNGHEWGRGGGGNN